MYNKKVFNFNNLNKNTTLNSANFNSYILLNTNTSIKSISKPNISFKTNLKKIDTCRISNIHFFIQFFFRRFMLFYFNILQAELVNLKKSLKLKNNYFLFIILIYKIKFSIYKHLMLKLSNSPILFFSKTRIKRKKVLLLSPFHLITKIVQWMAVNVKKLSVKDTLLKALHKELLNSFIFSFLGYYKIKAIKPKKNFKMVMNRFKKKKVTFKK